MRRYLPLVILQDSSYFEWEAVCYPNQHSVNLGWPHHDAALAYLVERIPDDLVEEPKTERPFIGHFTDTVYDTDQYIMVYNTDLCMAGLWEIIEDGEDE